MAYKHGTYQTETGSDISLPVTLSYGHFIVGNAPINKVKAENRKTNEVVRLGTYKEAVEYFGDTYDLDFSISQAIKIFFELYAVSPLYVVNLVDLTRHSSDNTKTETLEVTNGKAVLRNHKVITDNIEIKDNSNNSPIVDAVTLWTSEGLEIYATSTNNKIDVVYKEIDLNKITKTDAIGGYDTNTMKRTGLELLDEIFLKYSEIPAFIDAPDYSHESDVASVLATKSTKLNGGMFETVALINAPITKKYDELIKWKDDNNINDKDQVILYGKIGLSGNYYYQSIHYGALSLSVDGNNGGVPSQTPSNYAYKMDDLVYLKNGKYESVLLDRETQANLLNKNGIVTALNFKGWRCWGSETALNPLATDPKDKYIYTRRMFKYIGNELVISYFNRVDQKLTFKLAETITKSINIRLNSLVAAGHFLEASAEIDEEETTLINVINGDITWRINLGIIPAVKSLTFKKKYNSEAISRFAEALKNL